MIAAAAAQWTTALAESAPAPQDMVDLEEVVVTAQRREQRLVDVPMAISAFTGEALTDRGANSLSDVEFSVPGLSSFSYGPGGQGYVQLRGVQNAVGRPTVGQYFGEIPTNLEVSGYLVDIRLIDIDRVEVLRGPQPTLYGDGSMGGTIRYVPAKPTLNPLSGEVAADLSTLRDGATGWSANGHVDIPVVSDRVGLRVAAGYEKDAGWIDRIPTGEKNVNGSAISTVRATFLVKPTEASEVTVLWQRVKSDADNQNFGIDRRTTGAVATPLNSTADLASLEARVHLGFADIVEAAGYVKLDLDSRYDLSSYYVPFLAAPPPFGFGFPPGYVTAIPYDGGTVAKMFSNELRLVSTGTGRVSWAVGIDYKDEKLHIASATDTLPNQLPFVLLATDQNQPTKIWAPWAEIGMAFTTRLQATLGARYFHDSTDSRNAATTFGVPSVTAGKATFTSTNPRLNVSYRFDGDRQVFFNVAKGFRSGGFNQGYSSLPTYAPESLWSYELGSKGVYFGRVLELEGEVYYNDWKNVQSTFYTDAGLTEVTNGGRVKGVGFDVGATLHPFPGLSFGATLGWNNMEFKETPAISDKLVGDPPDFAVRQSWSAFLDYRHKLAGSSAVYARADMQHANRAQITLRSPQFDQITEMPSRDLLNARLGWDSGRYDVSIFANNVLDEDNPVIRGPFGVVPENVEQRPRQFGVSLRARL